MKTIISGALALFMTSCFSFILDDFSSQPYTGSGKEQYRYTSGKHRLDVNTAAGPLVMFRQTVFWNGNNQFDNLKFWTKKSNQINASYKAKPDHQTLNYRFKNIHRIGKTHATFHTTYAVEGGNRLNLADNKVIKIHYNRVSHVSDVQVRLYAGTTFKIIEMKVPVNHQKQTVVFDFRDRDTKKLDFQDNKSVADVRYITAKDKTKTKWKQKNEKYKLTRKDFKWDGIYRIQITTRVERKDMKSGSWYNCEIDKIEAASQ